MKPDTIWIWESWRRVYEPAPPGRRFGSGPPIWRAHWAPKKVIEETSRSWIVEGGQKVPKSRTKVGRSLYDPCFSEAEINQREWMVGHAHQLGTLVDRCTDYDTLQKVAALIGYVPAPKVPA